MKKQLIVTSDGSHSVAIAGTNVTYHSSHGAIQESQHVFIDAGLDFFLHQTPAPEKICIFEMGFGTGLNALLTLLEAEKRRQQMYYESIDMHPLDETLYTSLNYCAQLQRPDLQPLFTLLHECSWNTTVQLTPYFSFTKKQASLLDFSAKQLFHLIYFDAFAPDVQPELWTTTVFKKLYAGLHKNAVLTTYCSKSSVRKAMAEAGFTISKIPGPPHKREMVRAIK